MHAFFGEDGAELVQSERFGTAADSVMVPVEDVFSQFFDAFCHNMMRFIFADEKTLWMWGTASVSNPGVYSMSTMEYLAPAVL